VIKLINIKRLSDNLIIGVVLMIWLIFVDSVCLIIDMMIELIRLIS